MELNKAAEKYVYWRSQDRRHVILNCDCLLVLPHLTGVDAVVLNVPYGDDKPFDPSPWLGFPEVILLVGNHFASRLPDSAGWLVWDKERPDTLDQSTCEFVWSDCVNGVRRLKYLWNGMMKAGEHGENYHPTQKPVALMVWCIGFTTGATILDPYMGSGTTGVACIRTGRRFIGVEIEPKYCAIAVERMERELARPYLPTMEPDKLKQEALL